MLRSMAVTALVGMVVGMFCLVGALALVDKILRGMP